MQDLADTPQWPALEAHARRLMAADMAPLLCARDRAAALTVEAAGWVMDFSRQHLDDVTFSTLVIAAQALDVTGARDRMLAGAPVNSTEGRAALHTLLRHPDPARSPARALPGVQDILPTRARMAAFVEAVQGGRIAGSTGQRFTDVVSIGIGGSDLGPRMVSYALLGITPPRLRVHFVRNVDATDLDRTLSGLDPARTLVVIASKTFTTQETMTNAASVRAWLTSALGDGAMAAHGVALSTNLAAVSAFGIPPERTFGFWDWVGGRYSLWSAIGLPAALSLGWPAFEALLAGAHAMDAHFATAPVETNLPMLLGLLSVWNRALLGLPVRATLPYDQRLALLPAWQQQLEMESNGKGVRLDGEEVRVPGAPVIFGEPGTNGQHSFYQQLHQGPDRVAMDIIAFAQPAPTATPGIDAGRHHRILLSHALAQAEAFSMGRPRWEAQALMMGDGKDAEEAARLAPHKGCPGGRPVTLLLSDALTPHRLGSLLALYEHATFVHGVCSGINSFDQMGVELGKELAGGLLAALEDPAQAPDNTSQATLGTLATLARLKVQTGHGALSDQSGPALSPSRPPTGG